MTARNAFRFNANFRVIYEDEEGHMAADVVDASETGLFLETTMALSPGSEISMSIFGNPQVDFHDVKATVVRSDHYDPINKVWVRPEGMAVEFHGLTDTQKVALADLAVQSVAA